MAGPVATQGRGAVALRGAEEAISPRGTYGPFVPAEDGSGFRSHAASRLVAGGFGRLALLVSGVTCRAAVATLPREVPGLVGSPEISASGAANPLHGARVTPRTIGTSRPESRSSTSGSQPRLHFCR